MAHLKQRQFEEKQTAAELLTVKSFTVTCEFADWVARQADQWLQRVLPFYMKSQPPPPADVDGQWQFLQKLPASDAGGGVDIALEYRKTWFWLDTRLRSGPEGQDRSMTLKYKHIIVGGPRGSMKTANVLSCWTYLRSRHISGSADRNSAVCYQDRSVLVAHSNALASDARRSVQNVCSDRVYQVFNARGKPRKCNFAFSQDKAMVEIGRQDINITFNDEAQKLGKHYAMLFAVRRRMFTDSQSFSPQSPEEIMLAMISAMDHKQIKNISFPFEGIEPVEVRRNDDAYARDINREEAADQIGRTQQFVKEIHSIDMADEERRWLERADLEEVCILSATKVFRYPLSRFKMFSSAVELPATEYHDIERATVIVCVGNINWKDMPKSCRRLLKGFTFMHDLRVQANALLGLDETHIRWKRILSSDNALGGSYPKLW